MRYSQNLLPDIGYWDMSEGDPRNRFQAGRLSALDGPSGVITSSGGNCFEFGIECIDLGPYCDPCEEDWPRILKCGDWLLYSPGCSYTVNSEILNVAKRVIVPETSDGTDNYLAVVVRSRHPISRQGAVAALLCPPFGIVPLHQYALGYDPVTAWPLSVGLRIFVNIETSDETVRAWKLVSVANDAHFSCKISSLKTIVPRIYKWQWESIFNDTGLFSLPVSTAKNHAIAEHQNGVANVESLNALVSRTSLETDTVKPSVSKNENESASLVMHRPKALHLLDEILNDRKMRELVENNHKKAFQEYVRELISIN